MSAVEQYKPHDDAPAETSGGMVAMIERIVMDPSIPIDRLEQMLAMKERMEDRAREDQDRIAKRAYFLAMSQCQTELPVVRKNQKNTHTKSEYADLAAIERQAMPIIHKHGFAVSFQPDGYEDNGDLRIKWEISHADGHSRSDVAFIPIDNKGAQGTVNKTGTQAFGSTATYGRRYLLCMLFNISTGDDKDGNAVRPPADTITEDQVIELREMIEATNSDMRKFLDIGGYERLDDMLAVDFKGAMTMLRQKARR